VKKRSTVKKIFFGRDGDSGTWGKGRRGKYLREGKWNPVVDKKIVPKAYHASRIGGGAWKSVEKLVRKSIRKTGRAKTKTGGKKKKGLNFEKGESSLFAAKATFRAKRG